MSQKNENQLPITFLGGGKVLFAKDPEKPMREYIVE
jgi:hypothetical protein